MRLFFCQFLSLSSLSDVHHGDDDQDVHQVDDDQDVHHGDDQDNDQDVHQVDDDQGEVKDQWKREEERPNGTARWEKKQKRGKSSKNRKFKPNGTARWEKSKKKGGGEGGGINISLLVGRYFSCPPTCWGTGVTRVTVVTFLTILIHFLQR